MFCPNCGEKIPENALFCIKCGLDLRKYLERRNEAGKTSVQKKRAIKSKDGNANFEIPEKGVVSRDISSGIVQEDKSKSIGNNKQPNVEERKERKYIVSKVPLAPMENPDWFSPSRPYRGKWAYCITDSEWKSHPEIEKMRNLVMSGKAASVIDDIDEVFDIAKGFLPQIIEWNENGMINMPGFQMNGRAFTQQNAYDVRYYSLIATGVETAFYKWIKRVSFSRKYIATALWETWLVWFNLMSEKIIFGESLDSFLSKEDKMNYYSLKSAVTGVEFSAGHYIPLYTNQYLLIDIFAVLSRMFNNTKFHEFSRLIFITYPKRTIAEGYLDADENPVEKIDFMYFTILALHSEEKRLDTVLKNRSGIDQEQDSQMFLSYSKEQAEILRRDLEILGYSDLLKSANYPFEAGHDVRFQDIYKIVTSNQSLNLTLGVTLSRLKRKIDFLNKRVGVTN